MALVDMDSVVHGPATDPAEDLDLIVRVRHLEAAVVGLRAEDSRLGAAIARVLTETSALKRCFETVRLAGTVVAMAPSLLWPPEQEADPHLGPGERMGPKP